MSDRMEPALNKHNGIQTIQRDFSVSKGDTRVTGDHTMIEEQPTVIVRAVSKCFRTK